MKSPIADSLSVGKKISENFSEMSGSGAVGKAWWSSAALLSFFLFVLLNTVPMLYSGRFHTGQEEKNAEYSLLKLRQSVLNSPYEADRCGTWPWWVARAYFRTPAPDIVVLGDSQVNAAFIQADATVMKRVTDCATDRGCIALKTALKRQASARNSAEKNCVNLALGGAMPSDYYLMSKAFFTQKHHPKLVIIAVSPRSFWDATLPCASSTEIFQFFIPYVQLNNLANYAFSNPLEKYFWLAKKRLASFAYRQELILLTDNLIKRCFNFLNLESNTNSPVAAAAAAANSPRQSIYSGNGFIAVGSNIIYPNSNLPFLDNKREYQRRFSQLKQQTFETQRIYFLATLEYLKHLGVQVIVINMPMREPVKKLLSSTFWKNYRLDMQNSCATNNAYWFDLADSKEFSQTDFLDHVHLNSAGGERFAESIASFINRNHIL